MKQEVLMKKLLLAIVLVFAASTAQAQSNVGPSGFFGPGSGPINPLASPGPYRAINQSPVTGRTYSVEADYLTPKAVTKRQMRKRR
jgi:hypothetical protein